MEPITYEDIFPSASYYGHIDLTPKRAHQMQERDAAIYAPNAFVQEGTWRPREYTQAEASDAVVDRRTLMVELSNALETIAKLSPRKLDLTDMDTMDELDDGTLVQEANGELSVKGTTRDGTTVWQSPGDPAMYRSGQLCYPLTVIPRPPVEDDE